MKPKGKWKLADRIGLISLGYFMNRKTILEIKHLHFFDKQRKKSILYDKYKFQNISGPVALWRNYEKKSSVAVDQENVLF